MIPYMKKYVGITVVIGGTIGLAVVPIMIDKHIIKSDECITVNKSQ